MKEQDKDMTASETWEAIQETKNPFNISQRSLDLARLELALNALYVEVHDSIADDVSKKVHAVLNHAQNAIQELAMLCKMAARRLPEDDEVRLKIGKYLQDNNLTQVLR